MNNIRVKASPAYSSSALILTLMVLTSCQSFPCIEVTPSFPTDVALAKVDRSLVTGVPCAPPCWQNVMPGKSTNNELLAALRTMPFVDPGSIQQIPAGHNSRVAWKSSISRWPTEIGDAEFDPGGQLSSITIEWLEYPLSIGQLINSIGKPQWVFVHRAGDPESPDACYAVEFIWPNQGLVVTLANLEYQALSQSNYHLSPDMPVTTAAYLSQTSIDSYVKDRQNVDRFKPWTDFQTFVMFQ